MPQISSPILKTACSLELTTDSFMSINLLFNKLHTNAPAVKLEKQTVNNLDIDLEEFLGLTVFNSGAPKTRAKVIQTYFTLANMSLYLYVIYNYALAFHLIS